MAGHPTVSKRLQEYARTFPGAWEDHPWDEIAFKVGKKMFVIFGADPAALTMTLKLPDSADQALAFPWAAPTGYGLGRANWVSITYTDRAKPPAGLFEDWIDESYRAVAPKTLVAELDARAVT